MHDMISNKDTGHMLVRTPYVGHNLSCKSQTTPHNSHNVPKKRTS